MMAAYILSVVAFLLIGGYLTLMAFRFGVPDMVSDTFYQLTGEAKGQGRQNHAYGLPFTIVLVVTAALMLPVMLDIGGIQCLAFIGCSGLMFVGVAPNYYDMDEGRVHRCAATIAAIGCIGWCLSVNPWPTLVIALVYALYLGLTRLFKALDSIWYISKGLTFHPWYWAEVAAFMDVFVTSWMEITGAAMQVAL